jgi:excinuclease UvrABC ATPase subunit
LLYARVGVPHCPVCGKKIAGQTVTQMVDQIISWPESTKIVIMAPMVKDQKGEHKHLLEEARKSPVTNECDLMARLWICPKRLQLECRQEKETHD